MDKTVWTKRTIQGNITRLHVFNAKGHWPIVMVFVGGCCAALIAAFFPQVRLVFAGVASGCFAIGMAGVARELWRRAWKMRDIKMAKNLIIFDDVPWFYTHFDGVITDANHAAIRCFGERGGHTLPRVLAGILPNSAQVVARIVNALADCPTTYERIMTPRGLIQVTAYQIADHIFWRIDDHDVGSSINSAMMNLPMVRVDPSGIILTMNNPMRSILGQPAATLAEVFATVPVTTGGANDLISTQGPVKVMPLISAGGDGTQEIYVATMEGADPQTEVPSTDVVAKALEILPVALLHIGNDGAILASNHRAQELLGVAPGISGPLSGVLEGLGRPVMDWVMDILAERIPNRSEVARARHRDPECFLQITLTRVGDADSDSAGKSLLAVLHDATELKTLEQQFVQSQKMQAIGELAGGIAHDFNNLLTAITGHCDLLMLEYDPGDPGYSDLAQINQNANRAASLVSEILAFSRKQRLEPEIIDLRDTLGELTHLLNRLVGEKITLTLAHDPSLLPIRIDRRQLDQVLMNLVVNARDAMPEGGEIRIETRLVQLNEPLKRDYAKVPAGLYVTICVTDRGHGIPSGKLDQIFEPFFTTKPLGKGTGLGLSMAYGIIKQSGGYIFVDSIVDQGTTFTIYCPAHHRSIDDNNMENTTPPSLIKPEMVASDTDKWEDDPVRVILLVEDEVPVRAFAARALQLRGYKVIEAESGEAALKYLSDHTLHVDLFVTDVVMPGLDGPSWVQQALIDRPQTRVIFMSGYSEKAITEDNINMENSVFLQKPFSLNDLTETVRRHLRPPSSKE